MKESLSESFRSPAEPRQGLQVVSHWLLNDASDDIVLTSQYAEDLENAPMEVWGRRGGEGPRCYKLRWAARGLWVGLQASATFL